MKKLSKVIAITAVSALSLSSLSAYAADMLGKNGETSLQPAVSKVERKLEAGVNNKTSDKRMLNNGRMNIGMPENIAKNHNMPIDIGIGKDKINMKEQPEKAEEKTASKQKNVKKDLTSKVEKLKTDLAAKLEAGEITQEEYDKAVAAIDAEKYKLGGKGMRDMKHRKNKTENSNTTDGTEIVEESETADQTQATENDEAIEETVSEEIGTIE